MSDTASSMPELYSRRGLHGRTVEILGRRIIDGELPPGQLIEPEHLIDELSVSRTVVREAIKVLTSKGLLDARPRSGTFVLARTQWNLLDADVMRWRNASSPDARLMVELEEVRMVIDPWGARAAAERRTPEGLQLIDEAFERMRSATTPESRALADIGFHQAVLRAAGNELLERLEAVLEPALRARDELALSHSHADEDYRHALDAHGAVLERIRDRDPDGAFALMSDLIQFAIKDTRARLSQPEAEPPRRRDRSSRRKDGDRRR